MIIVDIIAAILAVKIILFVLGVAVRFYETQSR